MAQTFQQFQQQQQPLQVARGTPDVTIDYKAFSGKQEDWFEWRRSVHLAQVRAIGCLEALTLPEGEEVNVAAEDFHADGVDPERVMQAEQAWISLVITCKGVAFSIMSNTNSPSAT